MLVVITAGMGVWSASFAVAGEASAIHLRGKAQGIAWFHQGASTALFGFFTPYIYNKDAGNLGAKTGFVYAGIALVATFVSYLYIPEMKGRTTAEIDEMFELRLPARHFKDWRSGDSPGTVRAEAVMKVA